MLAGRWQDWMRLHLRVNAIPSILKLSTHHEKAKVLVYHLVEIATTRYVVEP